MPTFVMLTRLTPEIVKTPTDMKRLERTVAERIRRECPEVTWRGSCAVLGPCDYLDLFEAPNEDGVRSFGHASTATWTAVPWERFETLVPDDR